MDGGAWRATIHGVAKSRTQWTDLARRQGASCPVLQGHGSEHDDRWEQASYWQARPIVTKEADTAESGKKAVGAITAWNGQQGQPRR